MSLSMLIFDCQGVLIESIHTKATALQALAHPYGTQACEQIALLHKLYPQASCEEVFTALMERDPSLQLSPEKIHTLCRQFQKACQNAECTAPLLPDVLATLRTWHTRLPIHVCSSMPQDTLRNLLRQSKLSIYFTGIHGTPPSKHQQVQRLVSESCFDPEDIVMIGDSSADLDIALSVGTRFFGLAPNVNTDTAQNQRAHDPLWAQGLHQLSAWLEDYVENP